MHPRRRAAGLLVVALVLWSPPARAESILESTLCQLLGCTLVTNGEAWELYVFEPGGRAHLWAASHGGQPVPAVDPASLERARTPGAEEGSPLGVDLDGDGHADLLMEGGGEGFLDASDRLAAFPVNSTSRVSLAQREVRHSFFVASNVPFTVQAEAGLGERRGRLGDSLALEAVELTVETVTAGRAGPLTFGGASTAAGLEIDPTIKHLGDLTPGPRELLRFTHPTATASGNLEQHLVQITLIYHLGGYDMSQGTGEFEARVEYSIQGF